MSPGNADGDGSGNWLDRLEDAEFSESEEGIDGSVLEPPIDGGDVPELCRLLSGADRPEIRRSAAEALGSLAGSETEYSSRIFEALRRAGLGDDAAEVRAVAIDALYRHDPTEIDRLAGTIRRAVERNDGARATSFFRRWLAADRAGFRLVAATAMGELVDERVRDDLESAFSDPDPRVQTRAIEAYGRIDAADVEPLEEMLRSDEATVRRAAAEALASIGTEAALSALSPAAESDDERLRRIAVGRLGGLDRERTVETLAEAVHDRSRAVRRAATVSLIELYTTGEEVGPAAVRDRLLAEADRGDPTELAAILADVATATGGEGDNERPTIERQAAWLLGEVADRTDRVDVSRRLVGVLESPDDPTAEIAAAYLRRLEGETLEDELRSTSGDPDVAPEARARAESVLDSLKRTAADEFEDRSIEYTYVRRPSDYTEKHGG
jgi:HEAT repeat protein